MKAYACPQLHMLQQANNDSCCTNQMQYSIIIWWHSKRLTAMQTPPGAIKALINLFIYIYIVYLYYFGKLILFLLYVFLVARSSAARSKIQYILSDDPQRSSLTRLAAQCCKQLICNIVGGRVSQRQLCGTHLFVMPPLLVTFICNYLLLFLLLQTHLICASLFVLY